jgi:hypothetical protein
VDARRCSSFFGAVAVALAVVLWAGGAGGRSNPPVDVFIASTPETLTLLRRAMGIGEHPVRWLPIERIDETQVLRRPRERGTIPARAWIDCTRSDRVRLYFANWDTERFLVRDVPLPNGWDELARESLAQLIDSSMTALATDESAGMSQTEMASALGTAPSPGGDAAPAWSVAWGAFYAVQAFAPEQLIEHGPGLTAAFGPRAGRWRPSAWISTQYQLPESIGTSLIGVRLDTIALRAGIRLTRELSDRVAIAVQLGAGGDVVHIAPRQGSSARASLSPERFSWEYDAELGLSATVRVNRSIELWAAMLADADLGMRHYDVVVDGSTVRALTPWWVRPGVSVGVTWP